MSNPLNRLIKQLGYTGYGGPDVATVAAPATVAAAAMPARQLSDLIAPAAKWMRPIGMTALILAAIIALLLIVHYTYRPIFKTHPDSQGVIKVPFITTGAKTFWNTDADNTTITDSPLTLDRSITYNYSIALDIALLDPLKNITQFTPVFVRAGPGPQQAPQQQQTINSFLGDHNLAITLDKGKNDLIISTVTATSFESAILRNIPVRQPFTVGVVLGSNYMEVYMNGKLRQTKTFTSVPKPISGLMIPPSAQAADVIKAKNLRIWPNAVSPAVMRDIDTAMKSDAATAATRVLGLLSTGTTCESSTNN